MAKNPVSEAVKMKLWDRFNTEDVEAIESIVNESAAAESKGITGGLGSKLAKPIGGLLGFMALQKLLSIPSGIGDYRLQKDIIKSQERMTTPESLFFQAALPQAHAEEEQARQALFSTLSGGVLGPTVARGERLIGE